jgi:Rps23 Pro-64 3,4-dihydroxylase Tpa1-like proline 4-hydroxylase
MDKSSDTLDHLDIGDCGPTVLAPFPHFQAPGFLDERYASAILSWFYETAPWKLRIESFYEQYEFSLLSANVPTSIRILIHDDFVDDIRTILEARLGDASSLKLIDVTAHRLIQGQTIRIHNDYLGGEETHRFLIQVNDGWSMEKGGLLMLFSSHSPEDVVAVYEPTHRSGFGFRISDRSFHAVSMIQDGDRFTLVYTFCESSGC